jgi:hypothetical protein
MYQVGDVTGDHRFTESKRPVLSQWILPWKISLEVHQSSDA